jgi:type II secretory pathway component GspD/PulD (secretin)
LSEAEAPVVSKNSPLVSPEEEVPVVLPLQNEGPSRFDADAFTGSGPGSVSASSPGDRPALLAQISAPVAGNVPLSSEGTESDPESFIETTDSGFWLEKAPLNDVFQHLARLANLQYFHNSSLDTPEFVVTGELRDGDPVLQMQEVSLMFGLTIHSTDKTVYAFNSQQLARLPQEAVRYQLKYLRPDDMEQTKIILQPFLTPGTGILEFETKTNTLVISDNEKQVKRLLAFLEEIDQPKQQIAIETRILRVSSDSKNRIGVDWSSVLGDNGT